MSILPNHATLNTGGWLNLARQGLSPRKKHQASLGAPAFELEVIEQMGRFGFDFSYVLNNDKRIEYICGMFLIFGQSATKKEEKVTGNPSISWDKLYDLIAVEAEYYSNTLER